MTGSRFGTVLAFAWSLLIAARFTYGLVVWALVWAPLIYRATSKPRNRGAKRMNRRSESDAL